MLLRFENVILNRGDFTFQADGALPDRGIIGVAGANGSGKTTFIDLATGIIRPGEGAIRYGQKALSSMRSYEISEYFTGLYAGEEPVSGLTGMQYLEILTDSKAAAERAFSHYPEIGGFRNRDISKLSRGQWVGLLVASVLVSDSASIFIDEYMLFFDPHQRDIWTVRLKKRAENCPVFIITHDREFLREKCDHLIGFKDGHLIPDPDLGTLYKEV